MSMPLPPGWQPGQPPGMPGGTPFAAWPPPWQVTTPETPYTATYAGVYGGTEIIFSTPAPVFLPGNLPGMPGGTPFQAWPVGLTSAKPDPLDAAQAVTAARAAALTGAKPLNAAAAVTAARAAALAGSKPLNATLTVTAARAAALTEAKPLNAALAVTAGRSAAETTAKPLNATLAVTAALSASLAVQHAVPASFAAAPQYAPAWFPGAPGVSAGEAFAPWPPWTGQLAVPVPAFTTGTLTAATTSASLTAVTGPAGGGYATTYGAVYAGQPGGTLTATDSRTGGPA